jgi:uncharacterized protein (TIGR03435 family)
MTSRCLGTFVPVIALAPLLSQGVVRTQDDNTLRSFVEASVKALDPFVRDHSGRELTITTFVDRTDLLQFILSAYLDADGVGACTTKIALGQECAPIVGPVPEWVRTEQFEVIARLPSDSLPIDVVKRLHEFRFTSSPRRNVYPAPVRIMLQRLLEDRFNLRVTRERRQVPVWAITGGKQDLRPTSLGAGAPAGMYTHGLVLVKRKSDPCPGPCPPQDPMELVFQGSSLNDAADLFSTYLDRPVVDRTGLAGEYDFTLAFTPDDRAPWPPRSAWWRPLGLPVMGGFDVARLSEAFAGLGFGIESATAPFEVLIIEHVQRPSITDVLR